MDGRRRRAFTVGDCQVISYPVRRCAAIKEHLPTWAELTEAGVPTLALAYFHSCGSDHRPQVQARLVHDVSSLIVRFRIADCWVRSVTTNENGAVCRDSCIECFLSPDLRLGYLNFELNAGGTLHASHLRDHRLVAGRFADCRLIRNHAALNIRTWTSLPRTVEPEIAEPLNWEAAIQIPISLFRSLINPDAAFVGEWRANLYKCGDETSHPHWACWAPVGDPLSFHKPECFGSLHFQS